jgi:hypothetical protein
MPTERPAARTHSLDRRGFLGAGFGAGLGATFPQTAQAKALPPESRKASCTLPVRRFGKTGLQLPILAFGGSAMVAKWKAAYGPQLSLEKRVAMVRQAFKAGIRYSPSARKTAEYSPRFPRRLSRVRRFGNCNFSRSKRPPAFKIGLA